MFACSKNTKEETAQTCENGLGLIPGCLPLAVPFVAGQGSAPERYEQKKALENGTLFPDLNLPFHLKVNAPALADTPLNQLRALDFVVLELGLYLDTHPHDSEAFALFRQYAELEKTARESYLAKHGPLCQRDAAMDSHYTWAEGPWPWQYMEEEA